MKKLKSDIKQKLEIEKKEYAELVTKRIIDSLNMGMEKVFEIND